MNDKKLTKLIRRAVNGDAAAFEEVMRQKARQIIYISVKTMRNRQDGEDAAQEAMLKMFQNIGTLKDPDAFYTWMYQIVTRTCFDLERKKNREECEYLEVRDELNEVRREFLPQDYVEDVDKRETLLKVINDLPSDYRTILLLFYYEQLSYQEIAEIMGMTEKSVDNVLMRGRRKIKEQMERKHSVKVSLDSFRKAGALPVLTQLFQMDAAQLPVEMVDNVLAVAGVKGLLSGGKASGAAATGLNTSSKVVIGVVAATTVATGAAYGIFADRNPAQLALANDGVGQKEAAILTLEDMIGIEAAEWLRAFVQKPDSAQQWQEFLEEWQALHIGGIDDGSYEYKLYQLEKQDKQLLLLEQSAANELAVAFRFTDKQEEPPEGMALRETLQGWKQ